MKNITINIPYPVGTYLITEENGVEHIDQIYEYVLDKNGLSVILKLEVFTKPRLSTRIDLIELLNKWNLFDKTISTNNYIPEKQKILQKKD